MPVLYFFFCSSGHHRDLHSFPTRRSSDLGLVGRGRSAGFSGFLVVGGQGRRRVQQSRGSAAMLVTAAVNASAQGHCSGRSEEHTSELQSQSNLVCRLLLEKKKKIHAAVHR